MYRLGVIEGEFTKPLVMAREDYEDFSKSTTCWISKKTFREDHAKVKYHDHI